MKNDQIAQIIILVLLFCFRVMSEELARWKSALYYKYRESYLALQNLLEEHSKIRALNNATNR